MECRKFAFLLAAMTVLLLAMAAPIAFAARNEVANTNIVDNIRNYFADILSVNKPAKNCLFSGESCDYPEECCSGECMFLDFSLSICE
ncbi:hypothetical protein PTKIN_Ptkin14bG0121300 [Pterospermum kingtungense]